jgi:hypothetical protein
MAQTNHRVQTATKKSGVLIGQNSQNFYLFDNLPGSQIIRKPTATSGQTVLHRSLQIRLLRHVGVRLVLAEAHACRVEKEDLSVERSAEQRINRFGRGRAGAADAHCDFAD